MSEKEVYRHADVGRFVVLSPQRFVVNEVCRECHYGNLHFVVIVWRDWLLALGFVIQESFVSGVVGAVAIYCAALQPASKTRPVQCVVVRFAIVHVALIRLSSSAGKKSVALVVP